MKGSEAAVASSSAGGAEFYITAAPLKALQTAVPTMKKGEAVHLVVRSDCELPRRHATVNISV